MNYENRLKRLGAKLVEHHCNNKYPGKEKLTNDCQKIGLIMQSTVTSRLQELQQKLNIYNKQNDQQKLSTIYYFYLL